MVKYHEEVTVGDYPTVTPPIDESLLLFLLFSSNNKRWRLATRSKTSHVQPIYKTKKKVCEGQ